MLSKQSFGVAGSIEHFAFIEKTDRRNLRTQLKNLVSLSEVIAARDVDIRRTKLRKLIEKEDQMFEQEFSASAKARIESEIKKPTSKAYANAPKAAELLIKKRVQQRMNCCYEVREALRQKANTETRICLEQQMIENERKAAKERDMDRYWVNVQQINLDREDERQRQEDCLTEWRHDQVRHVLDAQMEEKEGKLAAERKEKAAETERINNLIRELELEKLNRTESENVQKALKYRKDLEEMIERKQTEREREAKELAAEHCKLMQDIAREEDEEKQRIALAKQAHKKAILDYINFVRGTRKLDGDIDKARVYGIDELHHVDICTKDNMSVIAKRKAAIAAKCFAELREQMCYQLERRKREEIERRENKMIENCFVHDEIPRSEILSKRQQFRKGLDEQIATDKIVRQQEEEEYMKRLQRACNDPEICRQLAEEYIRDKIDYLDPHPNWLILLDNCDDGRGGKFVPSTSELMRWPSVEPILPALTCTPHKTTGPCANMKKCTAATILWNAWIEHVTKK